jgi:hypothetical protein
METWKQNELFKKLKQRHPEMDEMEFSKIVRIIQDKTPEKENYDLDDMDISFSETDINAPFLDKDLGGLSDLDDPFPLKMTFKDDNK